MSEYKLSDISQELRDVWSLGEGPQVEKALYDYATKQPNEKVLTINSWGEATSAFHQVNVDDQFIPPIVRVDENNKPVGTVKDGDVIIYFDFRTDRAKPITSAFLDIEFGGQVGGLSDIAKKYRPSNFKFVTMTHYDDNFNQSPNLLEAFNPAEPLQDTYAEFAGKHDIDQLVVAESEKWRAVTWFKDGRRNLGYKPSSKDDLITTEKHPDLPITIRIVESRKVAAHIQAPVMRAKEITNILLDGVKHGYTDIFVNYANSDMVGHAMTNIDDFDGLVDAILELDTQLGRLIPKALEANYTIMITADHGNAEQMVHPDGKANPAHTVNKVPFIVLGLNDEEQKSCSIRENSTIGAMAPTSLHLRGIDAPKSWNRKSALIGNIQADKKRKIFKIVLDGYGINNDKKFNAMAAAAEKKGSPLHMDAWMNGADNAVSAPVEASGPACGYPVGEAGTTEFGHVLFDCGREVQSDVYLIDHALETGEFNKNKAFNEAFKHAKETGCTVHVMGITSDGMVHSSLKHFEAILKLASSFDLKREQLSLHPITDGRDVKGDSSPKYLQWLEEKSQEYGVGNINSVWGRGWGKDRDNRWLRIESAFRSLTEGTGAFHVRVNK